jgi:hypothetical protein
MKLLPCIILCGKLFALFICILFLLIPFVSSSQITGLVQDVNKEKVAFANVLILNPIDSSLVKGEMTDETGRYQFKDILAGQYLLSVSFIGFETSYTQEFSYDGEPKEMDGIVLYEGGDPNPSSGYC